MGLLASHGLTHHLLRVARARWLRRLSSSSSCSIITMAATPIKMLKWASCCSNSHLPSIVTTAEMTGGSKVTDFYTCIHIWGGGADDYYVVTCRWPADHPKVIHRQSHELSTSATDRQQPRRSSAGALAVAARQSQGKITICGLLLPVTVRLPAGDRQEIADPVITAVQGHENRPVTYRCANLEIRQKSGKNPPVTARFTSHWDVGLTVQDRFQVKSLPSSEMLIGCVRE